MKTKTRISVSVNKDLFEVLEEEFRNKSKYIEHLIYEDLIKNSKNEKIRKIII
jgi:metal-responsive CopG/Arc/MetJ family transcriptional regulator